MHLLFIHGAGGFDEDRRIAEGLGSALGCGVEMPRLPDDDMSYGAWAAVVAQSVRRLGTADLLVAHSFGASVLLKVLAEAVYRPPTAALLAMPCWDPSAWNVPEYRFGGTEPAQRLSLHHCRDDEIVPFDHLARHADRLPAARLHEYPTGGHQFHGLIGTVAASLDADRSR